MCTIAKNGKHNCTVLGSYLTDKGDYPDGVVDWVGKKANEDVPLSMDLPGIDLVEQSHHYKCVENHGEMRGRRSVKGSPLAIINIKYLVSYKSFR